MITRQDILQSLQDDAKLQDISSAKKPTITRADIIASLSDDDSTKQNLTTDNTAPSSIFDPIISAGDLTARTLYGLGTGAAALPVGIYNLAAKHLGVPEKYRPILPSSYEEGMEAIRQGYGLAKEGEQEQPAQDEALQSAARFAGGFLLPGLGIGSKLISKGLGIGSKLISKGAGIIPTIASGAATGAVAAPAYSAAFEQTTPQDDLRNTIFGGLIGGAIAPVAMAVPKAINFLSKQKKLKNFIKNAPEQVKNAENELGDLNISNEQEKSDLLNVLSGGKHGTDNALTQNKSDFSNKLSEFSNKYDNLNNNINNTNSDLESKQNDILNDVSNGNHGNFGSLTNNREGFAQKLKDKYWEVFNKAKADYNDFFSKNNVGDEKLELSDPSINNLPKEMTPEGITDYLSKVKSGELDKVDNSISFRDAVEKRNLLAEQERYYSKMLGSQERKEHLDILSKFNALDNDIQNFMDKHEGIADEYNALQNNYKESVVPFKKDSDIRKMANNVIQDPSDLTSIFRNPTEWDLKVIDQLGDEGRKSILYDYLGRTASTKTDNSFANAISKMDEKGLIRYIPDNLNDKIRNFIDLHKIKTNLEGQLPEAQKAAKLVSDISSNPSSIGNLAQDFNNRTPAAQNVIKTALQKGNKNILYDIFGQHGVHNDEGNFYNAIMGLDDKNLGSALDEEASDKIASIKNNIERKNILQSRLNSLNTSLDSAKKQYKMGNILKKTGIFGGVGVAGYFLPRGIKRVISPIVENDDNILSSEDEGNNL